jgi:hypothetical protein
MNEAVARLKRNYRNVLQPQFEIKLEPSYVITMLYSLGFSVASGKNRAKKPLFLCLFGKYNS